MSIPSIALELLQFTSAMQCFRTSIPEFSKIIQPLLDALERSYKIAEKKTKTDLHRISLDTVGWAETELSAFKKCKEALCKRILLAHRDHNKRLCFYVDASDTHWTRISTQIPIEDVHLLHSEK